jgi:hypothetical protein
MSKKDKKLEKKDEPTTELSEQELDNVAGGGALPIPGADAINTSRSNIKGN